MTDYHSYRWKLLRLATAVVTVLAIAVIATVAGASAASAKCKPNRPDDGVYYWDGWNRSSGVSVYSDIYNYSPWVRSSDGVTSWVMVHNGGNEWAQVGWLESTGGVRNTFTQWVDSGYYYENTYSPQPVGSFSYYTTLWNNTPGKFTFQVNSKTIDTENASWTPNATQINGEIISLWNQMPGAVQNNENFNDSHAYTSSWQAFNGTTSYNGTYFGNNRVSNTDDDIWDKACQY